MTHSTFRIPVTVRDASMLIAWSSELRTAPIGYLIVELKASTVRGLSAQDAERHLEGIGAITENHSAYEERQLLNVLEVLTVDAGSKSVLGDLSRPGEPCERGTSHRVYRMPWQGDPWVNIEWDRGRA
ncbi:MAG: hypothetical protein ACTHXA_04870 [Gulosibacter sp.]|uniref:hypothetical protein n=1 Tax=Gulosibacter sp. TaxID=2817531 RepID=UPI003F8F4108